VSKLVDVVKKKNKGGVAVKAHQVWYISSFLFSKVKEEKRLNEA
jgi:hypothetical protein